MCILWRTAELSRGNKATLRGNNCTMCTQAVYKSEYGSAKDDVKNGGSGVYLEYPDGTSDTICMSSAKHCNNCDSEARAIAAAAEKLNI